MPRNYVRWALSRTQKALTPLRFSIMMAKHADFWDDHIQPAIKALPGRADQHWSWPDLRLWMPLLQLVQWPRCRALVALLQSDKGFAVPSAMLFMIERYPSVDSAVPTKSVFVWYLTTAPTDRLEALGVREAPSLGRSCLRSSRARTWGRMAASGCTPTRWEGTGCSAFTQAIAG
jgi:hypothetical protein